LYSNRSFATYAVAAPRRLILTPFDSGHSAMLTQGDAPGPWVRCGPLLISGVPLLYVLSTGLVYRFVGKNGFVDALYQPIGWAMQQSDLIFHLVVAYLYLWGVGLVIPR
jgi:hypothetical protein